MEQGSAESSLFFDELGNVGSVEDSFEQFTDIFDNFDSDWGLYLSYELVNFPFFKPEQDFLGFDDIGLHCSIVFGIVLIKPLNYFKDVVGKGNIFVDPFFPLFDVLTDFGELENWFNKFEDVHDHEFDALGNTVEVKGLVEFVAWVENIVDLQSVFRWVANEGFWRCGFLVIQNSCLVHEQVVIDENALSPQIKSISPEVIQFVNVNTSFLVGNQLKLPFPHSIRFSVDQVHDSFDLRSSDGLSLD